MATNKNSLIEKSPNYQGCAQDSILEKQRDIPCFFKVPKTWGFEGYWYNLFLVIRVIMLFSFRSESSPKLFHVSSRPFSPKLRRDSNTVGHNRTCIWKEIGSGIVPFTQTKTQPPWKMDTFSGRYHDSWQTSSFMSIIHMDDMGCESRSILRNLKFWRLDFQLSGFDTDRV